MDLNNRNPQPGMRPDINDPPPNRPLQYANGAASRPSTDGMSPPQQPSPSPTQQPAYPTNDVAVNPTQPMPHDQTNNQAQPQPQVLEPTHHSSSKPVVLAIITLLIACGLAVAAFFAFRDETSIKSNKVNTPPPSQSQSSATTEEQLDDATKDINQQTDNLNDTQDFSDTELSDQSLGL